MWRKPLVGEVSCQRPRVVQKMLPTQLVVSLPSALRIAALYMLVRGGIGLVWPLLRLGPNHPEFQAQSAAYRSGAHSRELILSVACIVAGVGLFWHHAWGAHAGAGLAHNWHHLRRELLCLGLFERTTDASRPPLVSRHRGRVEWDVVLHYLSSGTLTCALKIND